MALHYRRSRKIAPGIRATVSKSGGSLSFGGKGYRKTVSSRGVTTTYGIPGTGLYSRQTKSWKTIARENKQREAQREYSVQLQSQAFAESPLLMILSILCVAFGCLSIVIPQLSLWWLPVGIISGLFFGIWGVDHAQRKVIEKDSQNNSNISSVQNSSENDELKYFYKELEIRKEKYIKAKECSESTNFIDTLEHNSQAMLEYINWLYKMKEKGMPMDTSESYEQLVEMANDFYNDNSFRIASNIEKEVDTFSKARYAISKIYLIKRKLKDSSNRDITEHNLLTIISNLDKIKP